MRVRSPIVCSSCSCSALRRTVEWPRPSPALEWPGVEADLDFRPSALTSRRQALPLESLAGHRGLWALEDPKAVDVRATEHDVEADLGGVPFRGIVDRLDEEGDGLVVTDYKSGKAPSARFRRGRLDQVLLYAAAVEQATGRCRCTPGCCTRSAACRHQGHPEEIDSVVDKLVGTWAAINTACDTDEFEPRTGPLCGWCLLRRPVPRRHQGGREAAGQKGRRRRCDAWRRRMDGQLITR